MKIRKSDIEKYLRGELSPVEMHALEKEALKDPFLAEALEGVEQAGPDNFLYDLHRINRSIHDRSRRRKRNQSKALRMWGWTSGIAATVLLLAVSGFLVISILREQAASRRALKELALVSDNGAEPDTVVIALPNEVAVAVLKTRPVQETPPASIVKPPARSTDVRTAEQRDEALNAPLLPPLEEPETALPDDRAAEAEEAEEPTAAATERKRMAGQPSGENTIRRGTEAGEATGAGTKEHTIVLEGRVTSAMDGEVLPGVNVTIKGTNKGTVTDLEGRYQLVVPAQAVVVFSFIGFELREVPAGTQSQLDIALREDVASLSEVVVTGYGIAANAAEAGTFSLAEPDGGRADFKAYLNNAVRYPQQAIENKTEGKVTVRFTVETNGRLTGFEVLHGIGHGCDEELIRAIREGPAWKPSARGDKPFRDQVRVRYRFELPK